ncbi:B-cell receptor CD22-like [Pelodytes ibericus]
MVREDLREDTPKACKYHLVIGKKKGMKNPLKIMSFNENIFILLLLQGLQPVSFGQSWTFTFPSQMKALHGSCVEIPCSFTHPRNTAIQHIAWYRYDSRYYLQIFDTRGNSKTVSTYSGRTSLVSSARNSCTLRIDEVTKQDAYWYYPGVNANNAYDLNKQAIKLEVSDNPNPVELRGSGTLIEGIPITISCSVDHTCFSSPPALQWNKPGWQQHGRNLQTDLSNGVWKSVLEQNYIPSYVDHDTELQCTAVHHNGKTISGAARLNIQFSPKNTTVIIAENQELKEGDNVVLLCDSIANPVVRSYQWYMGKQRIRLTEEMKQITLRNVSSDSEPYSCSASNERGSQISLLIDLPMRYVAKGVKIERYDTSGTIELKCSFLRSRPTVTNFTWFFNNMSMVNQTRQTLSLLDDELNSGEYYCIANNDIGSSLPSSVVIIKIENEDDSTVLSIILGSVSGIILLTALLLFLCIYTRQSSKKVTDSFSGQDNYAMYGNFEIESNWDPEGLEYSMIRHPKRDTLKRTTLNISSTEVLEYATVIN